MPQDEATPAMPEAMGPQAQPEPVADSVAQQQSMLDAARRVVQHHAEQHDGRQAAARANGRL